MPKCFFFLFFCFFLSSTWRRDGVRVRVDDIHWKQTNWKYVADGYTVNCCDALREVKFIWMFFVYGGVYATKRRWSLLFFFFSAELLLCISYLIFHSKSVHRHNSQQQYSARRRNFFLLISMGTNIRNINSTFSRVCTIQAISLTWNTMHCLW